MKKKIMPDEVVFLGLKLKHLHAFLVIIVMGIALACGVGAGVAYFSQEIVTYQDNVVIMEKNIVSNDEDTRYVFTIAYKSNNKVKQTNVVVNEEMYNDCEVKDVITLNRVDAICGRRVKATRFGYIDGFYTVGDENSLIPTGKPVGLPNNP